MVIHSDGHVPFRRVTLGLEATRQILAANPAANVIILSAQTDDVDLESLTTVGAVGVWAEQTAAGILAEAIREVRKGLRYFRPALVTRLAARNLGARRPNDPVPAGPAAGDPRNGRQLPPPRPRSRVSWRGSTRRIGSTRSGTTAQPSDKALGGLALA